MSAMEELRRMLDERGVECHQRYVKYGYSVGWTGSNGYLASAEQWGDALLVQAILTPEDAVNATVGRETCHVKAAEKMGDSFCFSLSCGHSMVNPYNDHPDYCPWCGRKVVK